MAEIQGMIQIKELEFEVLAQELQVRFRLFANSLLRNIVSYGK